MFTQHFVDISKSRADTVKPMTFLESARQIYPRTILISTAPNKINLPLHNNRLHQLPSVGRGCSYISKSRADTAKPMIFLESVRRIYPRTALISTATK